jgi:hypothetical protein
MFVCLSSGYRPRYLRDIARSIALPPGAWLAFRYNREWIADDVLRRLEPPADPTKLNGSDVLIAYIDQHDSSQAIEIVPCRFATLHDVAPLGQTTSLQLELRDLAYAADLVAVNDLLKQRAPATFPHRTNGTIEGAYWFETDVLPGISPANDEATWEKLVAQLGARTEFANERFFYKVEGIVDLGSRKVRAPKKNVFRLRPGRDYELRLYHFSPGKDDAEAELQASVLGVPVEFTMTPELLLDSRYDLKRLAFRTGSPVPGQNGVMTLRRRALGSNANWEWDLDLRLRVGAAIGRQLLFGLLVGLFLMVTPIVAAYSNSKLSAHDQLLIAVVGAISSLLAGFAAAFGLKRSI